MSKDEIANQQSDFILYPSNDGNVNVEVVLKDETVWLTQKGMAGLFGVNVPDISKHLANSYETGELRKEPTISILETVQREGYRKVNLAENRAQRQILMKMQDWIQFLHNFLELSNYPILQDKGNVSALEAKLKAGQEYEEYRVTQDRDFISDFDKEIQRIKGEDYL